MPPVTHAYTHMGCTTGKLGRVNRKYMPLRVNLPVVKSWWTPSQSVRPRQARREVDISPSPKQLPLGELEAAAGAALAVLFAFLHAAVASEEAAFLLAGAEGGVVHDQGAAEALGESAGLAGIAAAGDGDGDIERV